MITRVRLDSVTFPLQLLLFQALFDFRIWRYDCSHLNYLTILSDKPFFSIANFILILEDLFPQYFFHTNIDLISGLVYQLHDRDRILMNCTILLFVELYFFFQCFISLLW